MSTDQLTAAALNLPPKRKVKLAEELLASLDTDAQRKIDAKWAKEAESRLTAFKKGQITSRPASDVMRDAKRRIKK